ncbi:hypothetical protein AMELA_G00189350 [Ameiurus melas]|uniref:Uncharacterized protein n=1 Tax=Ameiurus melas TaxID=219545 RepID=A0A7J6A8C1_AMEME|nr:hypothetical protein AMELA_G00189350 [Ameiurus melas]
MTEMDTFAQQNQVLKLPVGIAAADTKRVDPDHKADERELRAVEEKSQTSGVLETPDPGAAHRCISVHPIP